MEQKHPVVLLIEKLYQSRDMVASLYDADDILAIEPTDKKTQNLLNALVTAQFVVASGTDSYALDTDLTRILDKGLRQDTISYLYSDIGSEVSKIKHSLNTYLHLSPGTHPEVTRKNRRELIKLFLGLSQRLNSTAEELFRRTQINFARTDYAESRVIENKFYLEELEKLRNSYEQVIALLDADEFKQELLVEDLVTTFKGRTMQFFDKIGQTMKLVQQFSHRERQQEERTKLLRRLMQHLEDNPALRLDDTIEEGGKIDKYAFAKPIAFNSAPDINNPNHLDGHLAILDKLKKTLKPTESFKRDRSYCQTSELKKKEKLVSLADRLLKQMFVLVIKSNEPIRGSDVLNELDEDKLLDPQFWNYTLLHAFFTRRKINNVAIHRYLQHRPIYAEHEVHSGNRSVRDVIIAPITVSKEVLKNA